MTLLKTGLASLNKNLAKTFAQRYLLQDKYCNITYYL